MYSLHFVDIFNIYIVFINIHIFRRWTLGIASEIPALTLNPLTAVAAYIGVYHVLLAH